MLAALLSPKVGHGLYETGETIVDLNDSNKHVNLVCKVQSSQEDVRQGQS